VAAQAAALAARASEPVIGKGSTAAKLTAGLLSAAAAALGLALLLTSP
jgi:hypothetical protein